MTVINTPATVYRPVPGYDDLYAGTDASIVLAGVGILEQKVRDRYLSIRIPKAGIRNVHVLMAAAYLGLRPENHHTRHGEAGQLDNTPGNLCYGTNSDNQRDSVLAGTHRNTSKDTCAKGHEYTPENTYHPPGTTHRQCRKCNYDRNRSLISPKVRGRHISDQEKTALYELLTSNPKLPNREIARIIQVSPQTVARYRARKAKQDKNLGAD